MILNKLNNYVTVVGGNVCFTQDGAGFSSNGEYLGEVDENNFLIQSKDPEDQLPDDGQSLHRGRGRPRHL